MKGNATTRAQSGGAVKPMPKASDKGGAKGSGLKTAWAEPESRGKRTDLKMAKKRVR